LTAPDRLQNLESSFLVVRTKGFATLFHKKILMRTYPNFMKIKSITKDS
jgi:hypothetical protein